MKKSVFPLEFKVNVNIFLLYVKKMIKKINTGKYKIYCSRLLKGNLSIDL